MFHGSCLCKNVRYSVSSFTSGIIHCHCRTCQKAHATAFSSVAIALDSAFTLLQDSSLHAYFSSPNKQRYFCHNCGTQLFAKYTNSSSVVIRLGSLDDDPKFLEAKHIWLSHRASWLGDMANIPMFDTSPNT